MTDTADTAADLAGDQISLPLPEPIAEPPLTPEAAPKASASRKKPATGKRPPRDTAPKVSRGPGRPSTRDVRERKLAENLTAIGLLVSVTVHPADGLAVVEHAAGIAKSFAVLADENARVARMLDGAMEGSAWFGVVAAVGGLVVTIAANHGALPGALGALAGADAGAGPDMAAMASMFAQADGG